MLFTFEFTIPAGTSKDNPVRQTIYLTEGVLTKVSVYFPAGIWCSAGLRFMYGDIPIMPYNVDAWITGEDETIEWEEKIELYDYPYALNVELYNEDTYDHKIYVRIEVLPTEKAEPWRAIIDFTRAVKELVGL